MKKIILIFTLLSASAFAGNIDENSTWEEILLGNANYVDAPKFVFRGGSLFTSTFSVCVDGDLIRTKTAVRRCAETDNRGEQCKKWIDGYEYLPITSEVRTCVKYRETRDESKCVQWETHKTSIPLSYTFNVYRRSGKDGDRHTFLFSKDYDLPACQ